ncbi:hypothetical protein, partial [Klebsiella pneumoniae]|uniref:hypothetical protein n=1 Tax=Klebsiella pneumoniae TaxID=573 RepID=UPI003EE03E47
GASFEVSAGNLERFDVVATVWGFEATCVFVQYAESDEDSIAAKFQTTKPIRATLAFTKFDPDADKEAPPFRITGVVHSRRVQEIADDK